jgi:hypothetical protein
VFDGKELTRREILYTFLYGHFAHVEPAKRERYQGWKKMGSLSRSAE